jgi:hypothetical protein
MNKALKCLIKLLILFQKKQKKSYNLVLKSTETLLINFELYVNKKIVYFDFWHQLSESKSEDEDWIKLRSSRMFIYA